MPYFFFKPSFGSHNRQAKLNEKEVRHIFCCVKAGIDRASLAALFGVSVKTVNHILYGSCWRKVTADLRKANV